MLDFPPLDESAIRDTAVRDIFDRIDRAGTRLGIAAQKHGVALAGGASVEADAAWRESERELRREKLAFAILTRDARRVILEAIAGVAVVHDRAPLVPYRLLTDEQIADNCPPDGLLGRAQSDATGHP